MINKIKQLRKKLGMTQEELANICGVSRQTINSVENDKYDPTLSLAFKIARALHSKVEDLFLFTN